MSKPTEEPTGAFYIVSTNGLEYRPITPGGQKQYTIRQDGHGVVATVNVGGPNPEWIAHQLHCLRLLAKSWEMREVLGRLTQAVGAFTIGDDTGGNPCVCPTPNEGRAVQFELNTARALLAEIDGGDHGASS